mmetsp:Transcript_63582/g.112301  ORF Transcript_63582/g.112301 Transcript_63582/m.112301 type:complete len:189 (-) Transcript_63582:360-926(-)|eukprot:CAMPEP_0184981500 /NCGR_PEP_ID=MMETSP1098-20130426/11188_1 /TAXON_ID=89044 /ORGANISM="Spumella elongata, Strain CCAP 955/1" /LENGTH=188 /DNA_ID=CAMNT_0027505063 /DNA_START=66 /DNA_END=632 /DNA_ORIENTATION=+
MGNVNAFHSDKIGFQVTNISPQSPGEKAGLQLTDFILTMNGQDIAFIDPEKIMTTVKNSVDRPIHLTVYNTSSDRIRDVVLTPSSEWPGDGLLGIKIKLNTYDTAYDYSSNVYSKEDDEENSYSDVLAGSSSKCSSPTNSKGISRNFSFGDSSFADFTDIGSATKNRSGASTPVTFVESIKRTFAFKK